MGSRPCICVIVGDDDVRDAVSRAVNSLGWETSSFSSAREFLDGYDATRPGCIVADLSDGGISGLSIQRELRERGLHSPIVFTGGQSDADAAVSALKAGAIDFLRKPVEDGEMLDAMRRAVEQDLEQRRRREEREDVEARLATLTPREREVLRLVVAGLSNKEIGKELGISSRTVEVHRQRVMHKMEADSVAGLVKTMLDFQGDTRG